MALDNFRTRFGKVLFEFVGTVMLVMTIQLTVSAGSTQAGLAIAAVIMAVIYSGGAVSGAHVNPAVTLSVFIRGKISLRQGILYMISQLAGGIIGALFGGIIGGKFTSASIGKTSNLLQAFLAELIFTALLCFVILATVTNSKTEGNSFYGVAIAALLYTAVICIGPVSGAAINPAVAIGLGVVKNVWKLSYVLWITVAELLGGIVGAGMFYLVAPDEFEHFNPDGDSVMEEARSLLPTRT